MSESPYPQIDKLRKKFDDDKPLSLREAAWVCWAELGSCWTPIYLFADWSKKNGIVVDQKFRWAIWKNLFQTFMEVEYPKVNNDTDLIVKLHKMDVDKLFGELDL